MKILGIIPARFASTRFPGKPLIDIDGKTMIRRVWEQARKSALDEVVIATDHKEIYDHVTGFGGQARMTKESHVSGTDRCYEAMELLGKPFDYVINIQGDEPFIDPEQINLLISALDGKTEIATLVKRITDAETLFNPNIVKVVVAATGDALYFSRATIPYLRNTPKEDWLSSHTFYKHIGMYAYRSDILQAITKLPVATLESAESLEQLRWLTHGYKIKVAETNIETIGIDTPADIEKALRTNNRRAG